jgi:hypothetical protein
MPRCQKTAAVALCVAMGMVAGTLAQQDVPGGPLTGPPVLGAPFSAEATTTVRQSLPDGRRIERVGIARYYRDRRGRVRVEHLITGLDPLNFAAKGQIRTVIDPDPGDAMVYSLDDSTHTANPSPRFMWGQAIGGGGTYALPLGGPRWSALVFSRWGALVFSRDDADGSRPAEDSREESLGRRKISGVDCIGRRMTTAVRAGADAGRPYQIVEERWESPELKLLVYGVSSDSRTGDVDYRLTNINLAEPSADLFRLPVDYTIAATGDNGWTGLVFAEKGGQATKRW